jgi:GntR family transcriptional regulator
MRPRTFFDRAGARFGIDQFQMTMSTQRAVRPPQPGRGGLIVVKGMLLRVRRRAPAVCRADTLIDTHCTISNNTHVIPFRVTFRPGVSLYEQVVYAAKKALISGQLRAGDQFPSVRAISAELKINPNTAHKVVTYLLSEGLLEVLPGTGTVVAEMPESSSADRARLLEKDVEQLVVEAKRLGIGRRDLMEAIAGHWERLDTPEMPVRRRR